MAKEKVKRKLSAILCADVVGYSRMMGEDETATLHALKSCIAEIIEPIVEEHNGRIFKKMGDGFFIEFSSAVDCVECAVDWQNKIKYQDQPLQFRIGINLGDVITEDDDMYGDGVNIAARIEKLADPGGICISRGIYEQIKRKINLGFEYLGENEVKNISEPVRIYKLLTDPKDAGKIIGEDVQSLSNKRRRKGLAASMVALAAIMALVLWQVFEYSTTEDPVPIEKGALPLPDKPSIAVLPFDNMSADPEQEYFSDGLTEEIITALSKVPDLFIIARNSSFVYKGKPTNIQQVGRDLGVRYVLEGSVRKSGDEIRITAQLIDAGTGHHIWAERYDRDLEDIFAVQDEITMTILNALEVELTDGEQALLKKKGTNDLQVYLKLLQGYNYRWNVNPENNLKARQICEDIISEEPNYASAYTLLAETHLNDVWLATTKSPKESFGKAAALAQKALSIDSSQGTAYGILGRIKILRKDWEKGISLSNQRVELEPNNADAHHDLGLNLCFAGRPKEAIPIIKKAIRLNPVAPAQYLNSMAIAYRMLGEYDQAIEYLEKATQQYPNHIWGHLNLSACYILTDRKQEAHLESKEVLRLNPKFSLDKFAKTLPLKNQEEKKMFIGALRKAFSDQGD